MQGGAVLVVHLMTLEESQPQCRSDTGISRSWDSKEDKNGNTDEIPVRRWLPRQDYSVLAVMLRFRSDKRTMFE